MQIKQLLELEVNKIWIKQISINTGLSADCIEHFYKWKYKKQRRKTLDILYEYFRLPKDDFYNENIKKWQMPTQSVLWTFLRQKRLAKWLSIHDVARKIKWDDRQIARIEAGDSLPHYSSYYITKFFEIYEFTDEEKNTVSWFIVILRDLVNLSKT
jgi:ribosome-binding protein aMBF1 (putative translation factor)